MKNYINNKLELLGAITFLTIVAIVAVRADKNKDNNKRGSN